MSGELLGLGLALVVIWVFVIVAYLVVAAVFEEEDFE